jgi:hypothetical protein
MNSKAIPSIDQVRPFFQVVVFNLDNELLTDEQIIDHLKVATKEIGDKRSNLNEKYTVRTVHRSDDTLVLFVEHRFAPTWLRKGVSKLLNLENDIVIVHGHNSYGILTDLRTEVHRILPDPM